MTPTVANIRFIFQSKYIKHTYTGKKKIVPVSGFFYKSIWTIRNALFKK